MPWTISAVRDQAPDASDLAQLIAELKLLAAECDAQAGLLYRAAQALTDQGASLTHMDSVIRLAVVRIKTVEAKIRLAEDRLAAAMLMDPLS